MTNFAFLPSQFRTIAESATRAEGYINSDPRTACFHSRFALEALVHWLYRHERSLHMPYDNKLSALLHEPSFQNLVPQVLFHKAKLIKNIGNDAVHNPRPIHQKDALQAVKELHHICYWLTRTYTPDAPRNGAAWNDDRVPTPIDSTQVVPRQELATLEEKLAKQHEATLKQQQERDKLDTELQALQQQLAEIRAANEQQPDPHDYTEAETRHYLIDLDLKRAGWPLDQKRDREYQVTGMPTSKGTHTGTGYADYVLWGDDGNPLAVVEAKKSTVNPAIGQQQAKLYADCLEAMHNQRPLIFYTNGYTTWLWDDTVYPAHQVVGFYKKDELTRLIRRRTQRQSLDTAQIKDEIVDRYYQKRAIGSIFEQFTQARRKALLVMATGTGKTRTAIALVDVLQRAGWVKRALFLADRVSLVKQAASSFKKNLPDSSPVNLVTEKDTDGRVYVCTYPTMMGLIDQTEDHKARFGVGHFDLVIIDEAHRSVYQKYRAIFQHFDSLLVGLTATPREEIDKNTYDLFDLEPGVPTDAYELETAVADGFLVPPRVEQVDLRFPREGIDYDTLSDDEKAQWESLDWGDDADSSGTLPDRVNAAAVNSWLFNKDTVDKVLKYLMEHGHKVEGGDRLAKTIIFARNHDHAKFIEERFNHHYPHHAGHFARIIDNYAKYPQSLIDDFSIKDKAPHIAISVDMLDTGIDVPEVANLVFFKPVYSKIKFWQMIGRGTRLCEHLFGPDQDKQDFRIFDFCFNFDFFREQPEGITSSGSAPLSTRLFRARVQLLGYVNANPELDPDIALKGSLTDQLYGEVAAMNPENFMVRMHLEAVEKFQQRQTWDQINDSDREVLTQEIAGLPNDLEIDDIESRLFDLKLLRMQLAQTEGDAATFERHRQRVVEMALLIEEKTTIPAVAAQLEYLNRIQEASFWEAIDLNDLEELRLRLRGLTPFLDKKKRKIVYTDFQDEIIRVREQDVVYMPKMTGVQYEKKVKAYLRNHQDYLVIQRLRTNKPLTDTDLQGLEAALAEIGADEGETLLSNLLTRSNAPSLAHFIRSLVGMDRKTAQAAFSHFLNDRSLTPPQIRFIEMVIDQLTAQGIVEASALYEPPFSNLHAGGPDELFQGQETIIDGIFETLASIHSGLVSTAS
ncbi:DEAD/DEAH box helicase family protein [Acaryochloris marina]|uniref:Type I restriction enzyme R protein n=1 Tax=Acaryochloris marina (strain MBIC 11017) TaxID=329726 RepID=B0CE87_ACAM1|nr:DEAD/DEAH box helicase family protein [Acaryochloris marina]ABW25721.1 type I restriction enzyme R protein [Acaryochloris marina MBIC11017]